MRSFVVLCVVLALFAFATQSEASSSFAKRRSLVQITPVTIDADALAIATTKALAKTPPTKLRLRNGKPSSLNKKLQETVSHLTSKLRKLADNDRELEAYAELVKKGDSFVEVLAKVFSKGQRAQSQTTPPRDFEYIRYESGRSPRENLQRCAALINDDVRPFLTQRNRELLEEKEPNEMKARILLLKIVRARALAHERRVVDFMVTNAAAQAPNFKKSGTGDHCINQAAGRFLGPVYGDLDAELQVNDVARANKFRDGSFYDADVNDKPDLNALYSNDALVVHQLAVQQKNLDAEDATELADVMTACMVDVTSYARIVLFGKQDAIRWVVPDSIKTDEKYQKTVGNAGKKVCDYELVRQLWVQNEIRLFEAMIERIPVVAALYQA